MTQRKRCGYTQEALAEKLNVTIGYVSQVERGVTKISLDLLAEIASELKCDISILISGTAVETESYYLKEIEDDLKQLNERERKLVSSFIKLLLDNREK